MSRDDRSADLSISTLVCLGVAAVTVALRCYVRVFLVKAFFVEDWLAVTTMALFTFYCTCVLLCLEHGAGKHVWDVPPDHLTEGLKMRWLGEIAYILTSILLKATVSVFLLRICSRRWQKLVIYLLMVVVLLFNGGYVLLAAFQCAPVDYFWTRLSHAQVGACLDESIISGTTYAATAINACADWVLGLLPIALVWSLELDTKNKMSVAGVLALGVLASTATLIRIPYVWQLTHDTDFLYVFTDFTIWSTVENGIGLAASSIATLRPLLKKMGASSSSSTDSSKTHGMLCKTTPSHRTSTSPRAKSWWDQYEVVPSMTPVTPVYVSDCQARFELERLAVAPWERDEELVDWVASSHETRVTMHQPRC